MPDPGGWKSAVRRAAGALRLFEILLIVQIPLAHWFFHVRGLGWQGQALVDSLTNYWRYPVVGALGGTLGLALLDGVVRRSFRGPEAYWRCWTDPGWWVLTLRLMLGIILLAHLYTWVKLFVPYLNSANYDLAFWTLEERLLGGISPNVFFLELFKDPPVLRFIDWSYHKVFIAGEYLFLAVFPVLRSTKIRLACMTSFVVLWSSGAWLYVLVPALGPCYWFPSVWKPYAHWMPYTRAIQEGLLENYRTITILRNWAGAVVHPGFGVAAFPSLHCASQALLALWAGRWNRLAGLFLWASVALIFVGSVVTGWHYILDSIAGVAMAVGAYWVMIRAFGLKGRVSPP